MAAKSITAQLKLDGVEDLQQAFKILKGSHITRVVRTASKKAIKPVVVDMKSNIPKETGLLRKSIGDKQKTYKGGTVITIAGARKGFKRLVKVKARYGKEKTRMQWRNPAVYAHLVEGGTRPHTLGEGTSLGRASREFKALTDRGRSWKRTRWTKAIAKHQRGAMHPGTKPQPFMKPAYESNKATMLRIYRQHLWLGLEKLAVANAKKRAAKAAA